MFSTEPFSHRRNQDGTIDSIGARCYLTVGTARNESELPKIEHSHACNTDWLFRWRAGCGICRVFKQNKRARYVHSIGSRARCCQP